MCIRDSFDRDHPRYTHHPRYSEIIPKFYKMIDEWFAEIRKILPRDAIIVIASDHGIKPMKGAFVINRWLEENGYLKLKERPTKRGQDLDKSIIDWNSTIAWAWGGYYSRVFINLKDREPKGIVRREEYEDVLRQLKDDLMKIRGPDGERWDNKAYMPRELYRELRGDPPDLMVYIDDLNWRPAGTIGWDTNYLPENDRGPDDAEHDWNGVFIIHDPQGTIKSRSMEKISITEIFDKIIQMASS